MQKTNKVGPNYNQKRIHFISLLFLKANFGSTTASLNPATTIVKSCSALVSEMSIKKKKHPVVRRILTACRVLCVSLTMPTKQYHYLYQSWLPHAWFTLSFASLEQLPLAHFLRSSASPHWPYGWQMTLWKAIQSPAGYQKKNRNWILSSFGCLICHLFNIDVHYVYGLFGCLLFSGPARPVWLVT